MRRFDSVANFVEWKIAYSKEASNLFDTLAKGQRRKAYNLSQSEDFFHFNFVKWTLDTKHVFSINNSHSVNFEKVVKTDIYCIIMW